MPDEKWRSMKADRRAPIGVFDSSVGGLTVVRGVAKPARRTNRIFGIPRVCRTVPNHLSSLFPPDRTFWRPSRSGKSSSPATPRARWLDTIKKRDRSPDHQCVKPELHRWQSDDAEQARRRHRNRKHYSERPSPPAAHYRGRSGDTVYGKPCPLFIARSWKGWTKDPITEEVTPLSGRRFWIRHRLTLIAGCTHYPLLRSLLRKVVGEKVTLVNPARNLQALQTAAGAGSGESGKR